MLELIIKAIVTGFILSIMIGPAFFLLLETSIRKGVRAALFFDLGILVSDVIYILLALLFYGEVSKLVQGDNEGYLKLVSGGLFLIYGLITFMRSPKEMTVEDLGKQTNNSRDYVMLFIKGFILNIANPMVIFYWFSVMALGAKNDTNLGFYVQMFIFISVLLLVFFSIDILKIIGAKNLRPFITNSVLKSLNRIVGAILVAFAVVLILQGILFISNL